MFQPLFKAKGSDLARIGGFGPFGGRTDIFFGCMSQPLGRRKGGGGPNDNHENRLVDYSGTLFGLVWREAKRKPAYTGLTLLFKQPPLGSPFPGYPAEQKKHYQLHAPPNLFKPLQTSLTLGSLDPDFPLKSCNRLELLPLRLPLLEVPKSGGNTNNNNKKQKQKTYSPPTP